jgi:hypothetical protein
MQRFPEQQIVLTCEECGERLIILGPEEDWRSRRAVFVCEEGHKLTLDRGFVVLERGRSI